jgi:hypothetical protein
VEDHGVERGIGQRQAMHVAKANLAMRGADPAQAIARDGEHLRTEIDADAAPDMGREEFKHAAGSGAGIEHGIELLPGQQIDNGALDVFLGDMQRADALPVGGVGLEIGRGLPRPRGAHLGEALAIRLRLRIALRCGERQQRGAERSGGAPVGGAVEDPAAFLEALQEARFAEELQMAADARLALAQDLGELAHRQLGVDEEQKQAQAGGIPRSAQHADQMLHGDPRPTLA